MIGIIGYGMVGKAVDYGFPNTSKIICDPEYNDISLEEVCSSNPEAIFICVPTPTDNTNYKILKRQPSSKSLYRQEYEIKKFWFFFLGTIFWFLHA